MQLVLRVTVLAMCVMCALALPNLRNQLWNEHSLESFKVQLLASKIDTRALSPAETNCAGIYNNRTQKIANNLIVSTSNCFDIANQTTANNNRTANSTVTVIRRDILTVQLKLGNCSNLQDNNAFINCITQSFNNNMNLLDSTNSRAYEVMAQSSADLMQVEIKRHSCTNSAILNSKEEMMQCGTAYNICLDRISQQHMRQDLGLYGWKET